MKRTWQQIGSLFLVFCMVFTMLPSVAFAETGEVDSGTPIGTSGTITAFAPLDEDVAEQTVEIGKIEDRPNLPDELIATLTEGGDYTATGSDAAKETETTVAIFEWTSDPAYDSDIGGVYTFTPTLDLPEGATVVEGVIAPLITVIVQEKSVAPQARGIMAPMGDETGSVTYLTIGNKTFNTTNGVDKNQSGVGWTWTPSTNTINLSSQYQNAPIEATSNTAADLTIKVSGSVTVSGRMDTFTSALKSINVSFNLVGEGENATLTLSTTGSAPNGLLWAGGDIGISGLSLVAQGDGHIIRGKDIKIEKGASLRAVNTGGSGTAIVCDGSSSLTIDTTGTVWAEARKSIAANASVIDIKNGEASFASGTQGNSQVIENKVKQTGGVVTYEWSESGFPPYITSISPASGPAGGGNVVDINGHRFQSDSAQVLIGDKSAVVIKGSSDSNHLYILMPDGAAGSVCHVSVTEPQYGKVVLAKGYTYTTASADTTSPAISGGSAERTERNKAKVTFNTDEVGTIFSSLQKNNAEPPADLKDWETTGVTVEGTGDVTADIYLSRANIDAYDLHLLLLDGGGNQSNRIKIDLPAYGDPSGPQVSVTPKEMTVAHGTDSQVLNLTTANLADGYQYYLQVKTISGSTGDEFRGDILDQTGSTTLKIASNQGSVKLRPYMMPGTYIIKIGVSRDRVDWYYTENITLTVTPSPDKSIVVTDPQAVFSKASDGRSVFPVTLTGLQYADLRNVSLYCKDRSMEGLGVSVSNGGLLKLVEGGYITGYLLPLEFSKANCTAADGEYAVQAYLDGVFSDEIKVTIRGSEEPKINITADPGGNYYFNYGDASSKKFSIESATSNSEPVAYQWWAKSGSFNFFPIAGANSHMVDLSVLEPESWEVYCTVIPC